MNTQKYLVPVSVAATVHVALFWFMPTEPYVPVTAVPLAPPTVVTKPVEIPDDPPEKPEYDPSVKPLLGAPAPFSLDEPPVKPTTCVFEMPVEPTRAKFEFSRGPVPPVIGSPDGVPGGNPALTPTVWDITTLDRTPRAKAQIPPDYPYAMKQRGSGGTVLVEFDVDRTGRVTRAEAVRYSDREFVEPALRAVRNWRFEPGRKDGRTVPFRMTVPIEFGLEPAI